MRAYMLFSVGFLLSCLVYTSVLADTRSHYEKVKSAQLKDPTTGDFYQVISFNVTSMTTTSTHRSVIKVFRTKANEIPNREPENIQTINFHPSLVDFILDCLPTHCYMVAITSRTKKNLELYSWQRTQFDLLAKRDTFARPHGVELFSIQNGFYIAVAQDQLHLAPNEVTLEHDESSRFIGCAIFKFVQGREKDLRYHQFIRLTFDPKSVSHYVSAVSHDNSLNPGMLENHYLVFSVEKHWRETSLNQASTFIWSPLDDIFWPFKLPRAVVLERRPGSRYPIFRFPNVPNSLNTTTLSVSQQAESVESCFNQLERLLVDKDLGARKLIDSSKTLWRSQHSNQPNNLSPEVTEIKAQVIVHGNVIVKGSILENPHITVIGGTPPAAVGPRSLGIGADLSPTVIDYRIKQAFYKLNHIRGKLSQAVSADSLNDTFISSQVNFFGLINADRVSFPNGISNPNVKINRVPFNRLENELISLRGSQNIAEKVTFKGKVVADMLEIHGLINKEYYLKDALDITSKRVQVIDLLGQIGRPGYSPLHFASVSTPELIMSHNATFNDIRLDDFITRDERTQYVFGRKNFNVITTQQLKLAHPGILLMGHNITKMAKEAVRLRNPHGTNTQVLNGDYQMFHNTVRTNRLIINNMVNHQINVTTLIHDSVKTYDINGQKINGRKNFKAGLHIAHLETDGALNGIQVDQIFNLNPEPPTTNKNRQIPMTGNFIFQNVVTIRGNLNADLVNGIDLSRQAVQRYPQHAVYNNSVRPQLVSGLKIFNKPLRIVNGFNLLDEKQIAELPVRRPVLLPLIDGISIRDLTNSLARLAQNPSPMYIDNLVIDGNLNLDTTRTPAGVPRVILGGNPDCPIDILSKKFILAGDDQTIDTPIRINSLRAKYVTLDPESLNGYTFPQDFVLKSVRGNSSYEPVFGAKSIESLVIGPSMPSNVRYNQNHYKLASSHLGQQVIFGERSTINDISYNAMRTFVEYQRQKNLTGEAAYQTINVYGNIFARRINGHRWPDDILLKSTSSNAQLLSPAYKRIYSPVVFLESSNLTVNNQLVLRGPVQLNGLMNSVNLSDFARNSVTYGDKDLLSANRPIRNKVFLGGITVMNEIRSHGLINNLSFSDLAGKVVTIGPKDKTFHITGQKDFMSDINFLAPLNVAYLNDIPLNQHLKKIQLQEGGRISLHGKKFISGNLKINSNLIVQGLVNKIDFIELKAHSIPLNSKGDELKFNKTLTVEGDVFMDNLLIDEKNGILDGVKLTNLLPVEVPNKNELVLSAPRILPSGSFDGRSFKLLGSINDCQITCNLERSGTNYSFALPKSYELRQPIPVHQQPTIMYPIRPIYYNGRNISLMRTTPPYVTDYTPPIPQMLNRYKRQALDRSKIIHSLASRQPISILYERHIPQREDYNQLESPIIEAQLEEIRKQMVSLNFIRLGTQQNIVVGFIESTSNDISQLHLPEQADHHSGHIETPHSFLLLDQIDYPFKPTTFHMSVGVFTNRQGDNVTSVYFSLGGGESQQLSVLPVEYPNSAMFLKVAGQQALFLLVSQDYTSVSGQNSGLQCPRLLFTEPRLSYEPNSCQSNSIRYPGSGVHVYLFHALQNSSFLQSAYFDLYQTIDLPPIDSFESFSYKGSTYAIAVSRYTSKIYLLLLRGFSGFELVSYEHAPLIESIKLLYTAHMKPILMIRQTNGVHKLMESVII